MANVIQVTDANFKVEVLNADRLVLVAFFAKDNGPCESAAPALRQLAERQAGRIKVAQMDVDKNPGTCQRYQVRAVPTYAVFRNGQDVERIVGVKSLAYLENALAGHQN